MDFIKFGEKAGAYLLTLSQIVFGAVVVRELFGQGGGVEMLVLAISIMLALALGGLCLSSIAKKKLGGDL